jgi:hypothetical protein
MTFKEACIKANVRPTKRQFKKWKLGKGIAKAVSKDIMEPLTTNHAHWTIHNAILHQM